MNEKICPLKIELELTNNRYYCIENECAWWIEDININEVTAGRCAIAQLANTLYCEVKIHE